MNPPFKASPGKRTTQLEFHEPYWRGHFEAMNSPCEILMECEDRVNARRLLRIAYKEAQRVEQKWSRYRQDNIVYRINMADTVPLEVDEETANLLDYASNCHDISGGLFDISSGILRRIWTFDGQAAHPSTSDIQRLLSRVGWEKIEWNRPFIRVPKGMEIDLGGIGKEYAVDRTLELLLQDTECPLLVNFGGDLRVGGPQPRERPWSVGVENPRKESTAVEMIALTRGALATSGDTRRYVQVNGKRLSHILNPITGWPVSNAPRSVTVLADHCTSAGILATLAMLHGRQAEAFLNRQEVRYWCRR